MSDDSGDEFKLPPQKRAKQLTAPRVVLGCNPTSANVLQQLFVPDRAVTHHAPRERAVVATDRLLPLPANNELANEAPGSDMRVAEFLTLAGLGSVQLPLSWPDFLAAGEQELAAAVPLLGDRLRLLLALERLHSSSNSFKLPREVVRPARGPERTISAFFGGSATRPPEAVPAPPVEAPPRRRAPHRADAGPRTAANVAPAGPPSPWQRVGPFIVDGFTGAGRHADAAAWILTHFHSDHYKGLGPSWARGPVYCSAPTLALAVLRLRVSPSLLRPLPPVGQRVLISGVGVTCFDANHAPGSVMLLFDPPDGPPVLHTGDFRWHENMKATLGPALASLGAHRRSQLRLVLDTTYCQPGAAFPPADEATRFVADAVRAEAFGGRRTLFLVGSYTIGKERVAFAAARAAGARLYAGASKRAVLACLPLDAADAALITSDDAATNVHSACCCAAIRDGELRSFRTLSYYRLTRAPPVVPMGSVSFAKLASIASFYKRRFDTVVGFAPSGWAFGKSSAGGGGGKRTKRGSLVRYDIPYSEHSSFEELRSAVRWLQPAAICPSVNNSSDAAAAALVRLLLDDDVPHGGCPPPLVCRQWGASHAGRGRGGGRGGRGAGCGKSNDAGAA